MASKYLSIRILLLVVFLFATSCKTEHEKLTDLLDKAFMENKISSEKTREILEEYSFISIRGDDNLASIYVDRITAAINIGGDSLIIDNVRDTFRNQNEILWPKPVAPDLELKLIAGKDFETVKKYLGSVTNTETVRPSNTPCPCKKYSFKNGNVEIVFINNKADWITVNKPLTIDLKDVRFLDITNADDFTYIKVYTR